MDWVRSKAKRLSLLALFALAMQIGLSFGHTHVAAWSADRTQIAANSSTGGPSAHHDADAICAVCVTTAMTASGLHAAAPVLPLPASFSAVAFALLALNDAPPARTAAFHSRAPPAVLT
ncbi:MAG: hypothetical protein J0G33_15580 [Afipia felis]|nr:hypothetical protein [Afipia felis]